MPIPITRRRLGAIHVRLPRYSAADLVSGSGQCHGEGPVITQRHRSAMTSPDGHRPRPGTRIADHPGLAEAVRQGLAELDADLSIPLEVVEAWVGSWDTETELPMPMPDPAARP